MTADEKTDNAGLIAEAKLLGVSRWHTCSVDTLRAKVQALRDENMGIEVKETIPEETAKVIADEPAQLERIRKKAPKMNLSGIDEDSRARMVAELEAQDPESKYLFQNASITNEQLLAKGMERTGMSLKNDIMCRTDKNSYNEWIGLQNKAERRKMDAIDDEGLEVQSLTSARKTGR